MANPAIAAYNTIINGHTVPLFTSDDAHFPANAANTDWLLVKFDQFVTFPFKEAFRQDHHLEICERLDENNVYLCKYVPESLRPVINHESATHVSLFPNRAVPVPGLISSATAGSSDSAGTGGSQGVNGSGQSAVDQPVAAAAAADAGSDEKLSLVVGLHPNPSQSLQQVLQELETNLGAEHLDSEIGPDTNFVRVKLHRHHIARAAEIDSVRSIEEVERVEPCSIVADGVVGTFPLTTAFQWTGTGETVHVADTGFDKGSTTDVHPAFAGRVLAATTSGGAKFAFDQHGHGTHVAGSVLGDLSQSAGTDMTNMRGTAPKASLVSLALDFNSMPPVMGLFTQVVGTLPKPTIHTNSWGPPIRDIGQQLPYGTANAAIVDQAMQNDSQLCILFAAGNDGRFLPPPGRQQQVSSWGCAKNNIVVGATESTRPMDANGRYAPGGTVHLAREMTTFSSRGPTLEGRIGIDVVAPGEVVLSARSRSILPDNLTKFLKFYGQPAVDNLMFSSGTSMSTPAVAGCVACLRQAYRGVNGVVPSGTMLKALIIHGAVDLKDTKFLNTTSAGSTTLTMTAAPNTFQGYGLVNMSNSAIPIVNPVTDTKGCADGSAGTGSTIVKTLTLPPGLKNLVVTLAYPDAPAPALQTVMKLRVQDSAGRSTLPLPPTDPLNQSPPISFTQANVAKVVVPNPAFGSYQIILDVQTADRSTPFAVVWSAI